MGNELLLLGVEVGVQAKDRWCDVELVVHTDVFLDVGSKCTVTAISYVW